MPHQTVTVTWEGIPVEAFVPAPLGEVVVGAAARRAAARAEGVLTTVAHGPDRDIEAAGRMLLRAEGVASSRIEAIHAPLDRVAVADADAEIGGPAAEIADNLRALDLGLAHAGTPDLALTRDELCQWHRVLMASSDLDECLHGVWRDRLGWVGGPTPRHAAHVASPAELVDGLMDDLLGHLNTTTDDPVTLAALAHAQFETIHPFADGNERLGRILIAWTLSRHLGLRVTPPVSGAFLRDIGGYLSGLTLFRTVGPDPWVRWFADTVAESGRASATTMAAIRGLVDAWPGRLEGLRADAAARRLVAHLQAHPALDVVTVGRLLDVSAPTARQALGTLAERGVLREVASLPTTAPGRPRQWWVAGELLDLIAGLS